MLVLNAHSVTDTSGEGFAVRLFRKGNQRGFIRALSDQPSFFAAGFNKVSHHCSVPYTQLKGFLIIKRFLASVLQPISSCLRPPTNLGDAHAYDSAR